MPIEIAVCKWVLQAGSGIHYLINTSRKGGVAFTLLPGCDDVVFNFGSLRDSGRFSWTSEQD